MIEWLLLLLSPSRPWTSLVAQTVKRLPTMRETRVHSLGREDLLEKEMATHSSILAWKNPTDGGAWWATVHGVAKSRTRLSGFTFTFSINYYHHTLNSKHFHYLKRNSVPCQASLSMGFCRQEYWSGLPFPSPGDLPDPGIEATSPALAGRLFTTATWEAPCVHYHNLNYHHLVDKQQQHLNYKKKKKTQKTIIIP